MQFTSSYSMQELCRNVLLYLGYTLPCPKLERSVMVTAFNLPSDRLVNDALG